MTAVDGTRSTGRLSEVARLAGVSVGTVSNYFNHPERVSPEAMERVRAAIAEVGYVRNDAARQLRLGHSRSIGLIVLDVGNPFFTNVARGAEDAAEELGFTVILGNSDETADREANYLNLFERQRVRGVLVSPIADVTLRLADLRRHGIESVLVDRAGVPTSSVSIDHEAGGYAAVRHLLDGGRRRIVYLTGPVAVRQSVDRLAGARRAIAEVPGARIDEVVLTEATLAEGHAYGRSIRELPEHNRPDGVFALNDAVGLGVLQVSAASESPGLSVPGELAVVGYDDIDFAGAALVPLTSVRHPSRQLGRTAIELLMERLADPTGPPRHVVFEPELIVRRSSSVVE